MLFMLALLTGFAADSPAINNPRFEEIVEETGLPIGWSFSSLPSGQHLVSYRANAVGTEVDDTYALTIHVAAGHPERDVAYNAYQDLHGLNPGKTYRVSAKMKAKGLSVAPMIVLQCLNANGNKVLGFARSDVRQLTEEVSVWERFQTELTIPKDTATVRLRIGIPAKGNAGGTAIIDDVEIVEVN